MICAARESGGKAYRQRHSRRKPVSQSYGSTNKSIDGIYADKSTVTVAEGGAVQGNKASMGGGIYMNASSAAVAKESALYNNKAAYGGDDLFAFGDNTLFSSRCKEYVRR